MAQVVVPDTFSLWGYNWDVRDGQRGINAWNKAGVTKDSRKDRLKFSLLDSDGLGAGVNLAQDLGYGVYQCVLIGRFDSTNPNFNVGAWLYNDKPTRQEQFELDYEHCQWGDQNRRDRIQLSVFSPDMSNVHIEDQKTFNPGSFEKHRITLTYLPNVVKVQADGWWMLNNDWKNYAYFEKNRVNEPGATFRVGAYYHTDKPLAKTALGVRIAYMDSFTFTKS